jgi:5'-methylthioadenosine phosphorylase
MTINKLAIIGGSGLYDVEEFKSRELIKLNTPWGNPSDEILKTNIIIKKFFSFQDMAEGILFLPQILILGLILMH